MSANSQSLISSFCRTCLQQLPCESSYNLFATPGLANKLSVCTSLLVELQDGFPENICGVCYTRLNEMYDFQEQCVDTVQKFQDMVRLIGPNEIKAPSGFEKSYNEQQDTNEIITSNDSEDININSENSMKKINECEQVALGEFEKIEIEETQIIQENLNTKGVKPQYQETTHNGGKKYECDICEKKFTTPSNLKIHKKIHTGEKSHKCEICNKKFTWAKTLKQHQTIHENPYVCKTCGKDFSNRHCLSRHEKIHSGEKPHKCEICNKQFTQATTLKRHKELHTGEKLYVCKTCGKQFSHRNYLSSHEKIHTGDKPHKCEICDKKFSRAMDLTHHENIHSGEKPYSCMICGRKFAHHIQLKNHEIIHSDKKPHTCKTCGKSYKWHYELRSHEVTHTGERFFACKTCGKDFPRRYYLNLHERRKHSMKKPFKCEICLKGFILSSELKRHKMTHTGESPFVCETCGKRFERKELLQIHQKKCLHVKCNESEVSDKSKYKNVTEHDSPVSSDMDEQEFISISSK